MKKIIISLVVALCPLALVAQQKIAMVNTQEIMAALPETTAAQTRLQELDAKYTQEVQKMQQEYTTKVEAFTKEQNSLSEAIHKSRQQELVDMQNRIQQSMQVMQQDLQKQQETLLAPIQQKVLDAIKKAGDEAGCTYVLEYGAFLHAGKDAIDLTAKVRARLGIK